MVKLGLKSGWSGWYGKEGVGGTEKRQVLIDYMCKIR